MGRGDGNELVNRASTERGGAEISLNQRQGPRDQSPHTVGDEIGLYGGDLMGHLEVVDVGGNLGRNKLRVIKDTQRTAISASLGGMDHVGRQRWLCRVDR